nr:TPA_asm: ND6 [Bombus trifasciatus]
MKTLIILNFLMAINLNINLMIIMNYLYLNIFLSPMKQLIYLIMYTLFLSTNILILKQKISLNILMILIIFISGFLILFSYFISLVNINTKKNNLMSLILINLVMIILIIMQTSQLSFLLKNMTFNWKKTNSSNNMKKLYLYPNYMILISIILFLILTLILMSKICSIMFKNLRSKKWKK